MSDEAAEKSVNSASFNGNFAVSITTGAAATQGKILGKVNAGTELVASGRPSNVEKLAEVTTGALADTDFEKDGKTFQVGEHVYVIALTDKTANKTYDSENVHTVDVRDLVSADATGTLKLIKTDSDGDGAADSTADMLNEAMTRLVSTINETNEMFDVSIKNDKTLSFMQKSTYDGDVDLGDDVVLKKQFQTEGSIKISTEIHEENKLQLQIGAGQTETIKVGVNSMKAFDLGLKGLDISSSVDAANKAIETVKNAIQTVSATRGDLGAIQNRLEHTINNLGVMEENVQDAEANIRDTDVADEMMAYTKNNILIQSAQAMLAQANQTPQGVLQLMQ
ncbi:MAG: hypothetical protein IKC03_10995 [Oscillospiraceae bacterium]|nr:hypothetical protein [Oscillospiraceae bacterium]